MLFVFVVRFIWLMVLHLLWVMIVPALCWLCLGLFGITVVFGLVLVCCGEIVSFGFFGGGIDFFLCFVFFVGFGFNRAFMYVFFCWWAVSYSGFCFQFLSAFFFFDIFFRCFFLVDIVL